MFTIHQIIDDPFDAVWNECRVQLHDGLTGGWAEHTWVDDDKLLCTTFYTANDLVKDEYLSSHISNPIPLLYYEGQFPHGEVLEDLDYLLDS